MQNKTAKEKFVETITESLSKYYKQAVSEATKRGIKASKERKLKNEAKSNKDNTGKRK